MISRHFLQKTILIISLKIKNCQKINNDQNPTIYSKKSQIEKNHWNSCKQKTRGKIPEILYFCKNLYFDSFLKK